MCSWSVYIDDGGGDDGGNDDYDDDDDNDDNHDNRYYVINWQWYGESSINLIIFSISPILRNISP